MTTTPMQEKTFPSDESVKLPRAFIYRRLHSILGIWLVLYLIEHLLVNSQSAFINQDDGYGFIAMVNKIHQLPYLKLIELLFLGFPFAAHAWWGVIYLRTGKLNAHPTDGSKPALPQYSRNHAYSWQRITSWILLFAIAAHVIHMRFLNYPTLTYQGLQKNYMLDVFPDPGLYEIADKLSIELYTPEELAKKKIELERLQKQLAAMDPADEEKYWAFRDLVSEKDEWMRAAEKKKLKQGELLAVAPNAGTSFLLIVRQAFKSPTLVILYSLFVVAAAFHALNGVWTAMITWGVTLTRRSQKVMRTITTVLMIVVSLLGLLSAWGTYWSTLFQ